MFRKYLFVFIVLFEICLSYSAVAKTKRVCVVGAGIGGISAARYLKEEGIDFTVFESTQYVGGTWRFDPRVGKDENGLPLHTSMYKNLRTNLPKPTMEFKGFPIPEHFPSFPSWRDYYQYLQDYAKHFNILKHIKFLHNVLLISRVGEVWRVKYQHVQTNETFEDEYDYVIIANGHFTKPNMPNIPGEDRFKGKIIHSHDYKEPEPYRNRRVLVVGAGPSGTDIGLDVADVAKTLVHSHHSKIKFGTPYPPNYRSRPDIQEFNETGVIFKDGTYEEIDDVIYCTGFQYDIPFLDDSSGLTLSPKSIVPLYRYMVNINQPSMILLGLIVRACLVVAMDAQARYATAVVKGNFTLPPHEEMMQEYQKRMNAIRSKGLSPSYIHILAEKEDEYYAELSEESGIDRVPPVMYKIRTLDTQAKIENFYTFRNYVYTVIDNENFVRHYDENLDIRRGIH